MPPRSLSAGVPRRREARGGAGASLRPGSGCSCSSRSPPPTPSSSTCSRPGSCWPRSRRRGTWSAASRGRSRSVTLSPSGRRVTPARCSRASRGGRSPRRWRRRSSLPPRWARGSGRSRRRWTDRSWRCSPSRWARSRTRWPSGTPSSPDPGGTRGAARAGSRWRFRGGTPPRSHRITPPSSSCASPPTACCASRARATGLILRAVAGSPITAQASGVPIARFKRLAFAVGSAFAGAAGAGFVLHVGRATANDLSLELSFQAATFAAVGGRGTIVGPVVAALVLHVLFQGLSLPPSARVLLYALTLLVTLRFFPREGTP